MHHAGSLADVRQTKSSDADHCLFGLGHNITQTAHGFRRYLRLSVDVQSSEMTHLPVEQLYLRAQVLVAKFKQGGGTSCLHEAIDIDREALERYPPSHPRRAVSLSWLAIHLNDRYDQLGATRLLFSTENHLTFARKDTVIGQFL
jgi:hypothetical protein